MTDTLFERLDAITQIIGGGVLPDVDLGLDAPEEDPADFDLGGDTADHAGHDHAAGTYTPADGTDSKGPSPGASALMNHLIERFNGSRSMGIYNYRKVAGTNTWSLHSQGRAGDSGVSVDAAGKAVGDQIAAYLEENADRLGVQEIIWHGRSWNSRRRTWAKYNGANPHRDHVHWGLTPEAAARSDLLAGGAPSSGAKSGGTDSFFDRVGGIMDIIGGRASAGEVQRRIKTKDTFSTLPRLPGPGGSVPDAAFDAGEKGDYQRYAVSKFAEYGWSKDEAGALIELWRKESGWRPRAQNPSSTAFGIAQFLNSTWKGTGIKKTSDPYGQIDAGLRYIAARYGSPAAALAFHRSRNWY